MQSLASHVEEQTMLPAFAIYVLGKVQKYA